MVRQLCSFKEPVLREKSKFVDLADPKNKVIIQDLKDTLEDLGPYGAGLSAIQLGSPDSVFVMKEQVVVDDEEPKTLVIINPKIVSIFKGPTIPSYEGCLTIPGVFAYVDRPSSVTMSYLDEEGNEKKRVFNSQGAAVALHEYDHLNGIWFVDRAFNHSYRRNFYKKTKVKLKVMIDPYNYE